MALLNILHFPDPRLREKAAPVQEFGEQLRQFAEDLAHTMYEGKGIGLAATQVGRPQRVIVVDVSSTRDEPLTLVNPRLIDTRGLIEHEEGCLSVPEIFEPVTRAERILVAAQRLDGTSFEFEAEGLMGVCIQHEIEHLDGRLFIDRLSRLKQDRIRKRIVKRSRQDSLQLA